MSQANPSIAQKSTRAAIGRPFPPGQSGNPGGRPKGLATRIREIVPAEDLAGFYLALWMLDKEELVKLNITLDEVTLADRTRAADWLADRGYGKAPQFAAVEGGDPLELNAVDASIQTVLDELAARRETASPPASIAGALAATSTG